MPALLTQWELCFQGWMPEEVWAQADVVLLEGVIMDGAENKELERIVRLLLRLPKRPEVILVGCGPLLTIKGEHRITSACNGCA